MKTVFGLIIIAVLLVFMWTPGSGYQPAVEQAGYTNVDMGTYSFFYCPKEEVGYDFTATMNGKRVEGVVCRSHFFWGSYQVRTL